MARDLRVCFVGDSFTAGVGDETGQGWVRPLVAEVRAGGTALTAYELGVRRETSLDVARRFHAEVDARLRDGDDRRAVLAFGANDLSAPGGRARVPHERTLAVLTDLLDDAWAAGWSTLVVGPPAFLDPLVTARAVDLSLGMAQVCAECSVPFVDVVGPLADDATWAESVRAGDGVHPGAAGYARFVGAVREPVLGWLD